MFEIGWSEILVIAVVAIIVVGPKDLPKMLRTFGSFLGKARRMAFDFQRQFNEMVREAERQAELDDVKKTISDIRSYDPLKGVRSSVEGVRSSLSDDVSQPKGPLVERSAAADGGTAAEAKAEPDVPAVAASASAAPSIPPATQVAPSGEAARPSPVSAPSPEPVLPVNRDTAAPEAAAGGEERR